MKSCKPHTRLSERVEHALDLPTGVLTDAPRIELCGNRRVLVEECQSILEYDENCIRLRTAVGTVRFTGCDLCMHCRSPEGALITGRLSSIEFL